MIEHTIHLEFKNHTSYDQYKWFVDTEIANAVEEGTFRQMHEVRSARSDERGSGPSLTPFLSSSLHR
jgi:hypothetical protein